MEELVVLPRGLGLRYSDTHRPVADRLYSLIYLTPLACTLATTAQSARLKRVSHLGLLDGMADLNASASKYEHSLGVYWLTIIATRLPQLRPYRNLLTAAAFAHDLASPPFTHTAEPVMKEVLGYDHEQALSSEYYRNSEFAASVTAAGLNFNEVAALAQGKHSNPLVAQLLNGPLDLDTLDGTARYGLMWQPMVQGPPYDPSLIAYYYEPLDGGWVVQDREDFHRLPEMHLRRFISCRHEVFSYIHGPRIAGPESLIGRSLYFAAMAGELGEPFFRLTDEQAVEHLMRCNLLSRRLIHQASLGKRFDCVYEREFDQLPSGLNQALGRHLGNQHLADQLAAELGLPLDALTVQLGKSKRSKDLSRIPMLDDEGDPVNLPYLPPGWYMRAFLNPEFAPAAQSVERLLNHRIASGQ